MKSLIVFIILISTFSFASSPLAPKEIALIEKISQETNSESFISNFKTSLEKKSYLIDKFYRLCSIHSLECSNSEENLDLKNLKITLKVKKQLNMDKTIEDLLNTL